MTGLMLALVVCLLVGHVLDRAVLHGHSSGAFERKFRLGWDVDADNLDASFKNGVLEVRVPKPVEEQNTVRSIPITAS